MPFTRRNFLKLMGLGAGAAAAVAVPGLSQRPSGLLVPQIPASLHPDPEREAWEAGDTPAFYHGYDASELWLPQPAPELSITSVWVRPDILGATRELRLTLVFRGDKPMAQAQYYKLLGIDQVYRVKLPGDRDITFVGRMTNCLMQLGIGKEISMDLTVGVIPNLFAASMPRVAKEVVFIPAASTTSGYISCSFGPQEQQNFYERW